MSDTVVIDVPTDADDRTALLRNLLQAAGDRPEVVRIQTAGVRQRVELPADIAQAAGKLDLAVRDDPDDASSELPPADDEPARNGKRDEWIAFLNAKGIDHHPDDTRAELIARWDTARTTTP